MASEEETFTLPLPVLKYSNRVALKTLFGRKDGGLGLVGERIVIGGWVKSSKEIKKEAAEPIPSEGGSSAVEEPKKVTCVKILQSIFRVFAGTTTYPAAQSLEPVAVSSLPSEAILRVSDGSCVAGLQVLVESSVARPSQLLPTGTCILAEGVVNQTQVPGKHVIELKADKIQHIGIVDDHKYPLSKKRLPLYSLRDCPHFRQRTTTVASAMRIRSATTFGAYTFLQNNGFLHVHVPIITATDSEVSSKKFQVTTSLLDNCRMTRKEAKATSDSTEGVSLEVLKASAKKKNTLVEELERSESNKEAAAAARQDLQKTNDLISLLEANTKSSLETSHNCDKVDYSDDFFSCQAYLTASGRLHLESYACALGNVYSFGPRFRANIIPESENQVAETWILEIEMAFSQLEDAMKCACDLLKFLFEWILDNCSEDIQFLSKRTQNTSISLVQSMTISSFEKLSYAEAIEHLKKVTNKTFESKIEYGVPLTEVHTSYLADEIYKKPVLIYNYPKEVKPFHIRQNDDGETVAAFDIIVPKVGTLVRGSQAEERMDMLEKRMKEFSLPREQYEWYLDLCRHGTVKHSGFSISFDLVVLLATGLTNVQDVIPFPISHGRIRN
ncbi:asparagine--tRNA ligase, cytoplasmic 2 [Malania oleifera]|uniref:asparagine--tRNA ligase, cytoplasmic 2 n=1 Tax=Malania oleifera TaxID=397392 RepID=UPI0025ADD78D|nr:asparagine--tRNA ligase, cytoplasmic 2 [Malania oleifera]